MLNVRSQGITTFTEVHHIGLPAQNSLKIHPVDVDKFCSINGNAQGSKSLLAECMTIVCVAVSLIT